MARKHRKAGIIKQDVLREVIHVERKIALSPESGEYEVQHVKTIKQGKALGSTTQRGKPNIPPPSKGGKK